MLKVIRSKKLKSLQDELKFLREENAILHKKLERLTHKMNAKIQYGSVIDKNNGSFWQGGKTKEKFCA